MVKGEKFYLNAVNKYNKRVIELKSQLNFIAIIRLVIVITTIGIGYNGYIKDNYILFFIGIITGIAMLIIAVIYHKGIKDKYIRVEKLIEINQKGLDRVSGKWRNSKDTGEIFLSKDHSYASDLDIFGKGSLFQMINCCKTKFGEISLAKRLRGELIGNKEDIIERQTAVKELSEKVEWRQNLYVEGSISKSKKENVDKLVNWCESPVRSVTKHKVLAYILVAITFSLILLVIVNKLRTSYLVLMLLINFSIVKLISKDLKDTLDVFNLYKGDVIAYNRILKVICEETFKSKYLNKFKSILYNSKDSDCVKEMNRLTKLIDWIGDSQYNAYYFLLNTFFMADIFVVYNLEKWKTQNGRNLIKWLITIGEFEAMASISNLDFDNASWSYPMISNEKILMGIDMAHPLIGPEAVPNNYSLNKEDKVTLITGSNMSGKSTFLRTVGINLVMSYIGAPTYSKGFECGIFKIHTCMRTSDNLEENISSFYAEILRIKYLIESSNKGDEIFFLLDEIFKGTNSIDRHEGARVLIKQLISVGAVGLVSTHDLELCNLANEDGRIRNYNFCEYYEDNKIKFDYTLREGVSKTRNAKHLMRMAGIKV